MRKPRENGWRTENGVTHHIDTQRIDAYLPHRRTGTCGVALGRARRVRFDSVDCMTCLVRVAQRPRLEPRPTPSETTPSWWTKGGDRHVRSANDPWRAVCGASLRAAFGSADPPNCVSCGGKPESISKTRSLRSPDGVRHAMKLDDRVLDRFAPCGAYLVDAKIVRKAPNCVGCRASINETRRVQEGRTRGRLSTRHGR